MRRRAPFIVTTALAGAVSCVKEEPPTQNPPSPTPPDAPGEAPTVPEVEATNDADPANGGPAEADDATVDALPSWDDVESGHPPGATNPPIPVLSVTPEGDCYKKWVSPFMMGNPETAMRDGVRDCADEDACGTAVQCPDKVAELLKAHQSGGETPK